MLPYQRHLDGDEGQTVKALALAAFPSQNAKHYQDKQGLGERPGPVATPTDGKIQLALKSHLDIEIPFLEMQRYSTLFASSLSAQAVLSLYNLRDSPLAKSLVRIVSRRSMGEPIVQYHPMTYRETDCITACIELCLGGLEDDANAQFERLAKKYTF